MIALYIEIGNNNWKILVYYNANQSNSEELKDSLTLIGATKKEINKALKVLRNKNTGFTFSNSDLEMSIVCIGEAENSQLFLDTVVHEAKHVLSHICEYYGIYESSEDAAYLIGYIIKKMYKLIKKFI